MKNKFSIIKLLFVLIIIICRTAVSFSQGSCGSPDGSFFSAIGLPSNYTQANTNSLCYNNLTAGQTYCWTYTYPTSGDFSLKVIINSSCGNCDGSSSICLSPACSGGCTSVPTGCGSIQYNSSCAIQQSAGIEHRTACTPAEVCGSLFTWCITVPAGCSSMNVCPVVSNSFCGLLPVELSSFSGKSECRKNFLYWTSASETNNDFYTLERSTDGENYQVIATIDGAGSSSVPLNYQYTDNTESLYSGYIYYRLTQTDFDGGYETFNPIALRRNCGAENYLSASDNGIIAIRTGYNPDIFVAEVYDLPGKKLLEKIIDAGTTDTVIDISGTSSGMYVVILRSKTEVFSYKVLIP